MKNKTIRFPLSSSCCVSTGPPQPSPGQSQLCLGLGSGFPTATWTQGPLLFSADRCCSRWGIFVKF